MKRFDCHELFNIEIAYDTTDHFNFICPECKGDCIVEKTRIIRKKQIDSNGTKDNCTYFIVYCPKCNKAGQRKIYWNSYLHDGRCERGRTNWKQMVKKIIELRDGKKK